MGLARAWRVLSSLALKLTLLGVIGGRISKIFSLKRNKRAVKGMGIPNEIYKNNDGIVI